MALSLHQGTFEVQAGAVRVQFPEPTGASSPEYAVACATAIMLGELIVKIEEFSKLASSVQGNAQGEVDKAIDKMTGFMRKSGLPTPPMGFSGGNGTGL